MASKVVITNGGKLSWLHSANDFMDTMIWHLFKNNVIVSDTTVLGDLTEADYSNYSNQAVDMGGALQGDGTYNVPNDKAESQVWVAIFGANTGSDQTVYGMYATADTGEGSNQLIFACNCFDEQGQTSLVGRTISGPSDNVVLVMRMRLWDYFQDQGDVSTFSITTVPSSVSPGSGFDVTVTALNRDRTTNIFYAGTVQLFSSDSSATLPSPSMLTSGVGTFTVTLNGTGVFNVAAVDTANALNITSLSILSAV